MLAAMTKSADITNEVILNVKTKDSYYFGCYSRELQSESHRHLLFLKKKLRRLCNNAGSNGWNL
jgi:hypothetical protein